MRMPKIWEMIKKFKDECKGIGWKTSENEDWVETGDKYHNFLLAKDIHPTAFRKIATNRKCVIQEGLSYHVVEASYTAWLFSECPSETLVKTVSENPDFSEKIALYDVSPILEGKKLCMKLNNTNSQVFQEFEHFLKDELKVKIKPFSQPATVEIAEGNCAIGELA